VTTRTYQYQKLALIGAAVLATGAIGWSVWQRQMYDGATNPAAVGAAAPGDVQSMVGKLEQRLAENPDDADGWRMLAWSHFNLGEYDKAAEGYRKATALVPSNADYWASLGESIARTKTGPFPDEAINAFRKALAIDPKDPRARYFLAVQKDLTGDAKGAIEDWIKLLADTPQGAPWEQGVRDTITAAAKKAGVDVAGRMKSAPAALPSSPATDGIPGPTPSDMAAAAKLPPGQQEAMVADMVDGLEKKLAANPMNEAGWIRLMRARMVLDQASRAATARAKALDAFKGDIDAVGRINNAANELGVPTG
jgi:cytochrome c-type biogenesis protein CcmH